MAKAKIKKMLEFENILNTFLKEEIPLALLDELYDLTYRQKGLRKNRVTDYSYKDDIIGDELLDNSLEVSDSYFYMVHWLEELTPDRDRVIELFKERVEIKEKINNIEMQLNIEELPFIKEINEELKLLDEEEIKVSLAISEDINKSVILDENDKVVADEDIVDFIKKKYNLSDSKLSYYNNLHLKYTSLKKKKDDYVKKLASNNTNNYDDLKERLENINSEIISRNIKLANWIIRIYFRGVPCEMEEMQGYAIEGLVKAVNDFDVSKGFYFSTFAVKVIRYYIQRHFKDLVGINWDHYVKVCRYNRDIREYQSIMGTTSKPSIEELYESGLFGYNYGNIKEIERLSNFITIPFANVLPLDPVDEIKKKEDPFKTFLEYDRYDEYEDQAHAKLGLIYDDDSKFDLAEKKSLRKKIDEVLDTLTEREKQVLIYRYGLDDGHERTLKEVGRIFHVTEERVRQLEAKALRKLRMPSRAYKLIDKEKTKKKKVELKAYPAWISVKTKINSNESILSKMLIDYIDGDNIEQMAYYYLVQRYCRVDSKDKEDVAIQISKLKQTFYNIIALLKDYDIEENLDEMQSRLNNFFKVDLPIEFYICYIRYINSINEEKENKKSI